MAQAVALNFLPNMAILYWTRLLKLSEEWFLWLLFYESLASFFFFLTLCPNPSYSYSLLCLHGKFPKSFWDVNFPHFGPTRAPG